MTGSLADCSCWVAARRRRTPRSWCSTTKPPSCAARSPGPAWTEPTGRSWPPCPTAARRAARPSPGHARHTAGLAPTPDPAQVDVPGQARPPASRKGDPRAGTTAGTGELLLGIPAACTASYPDSATTSARQPSGASCDPPASQRPAVRTLPGGLSSVLRRTGCWPATSSTLTGLRLLITKTGIPGPGLSDTALRPHRPAARMVLPAPGLLLLRDQPAEVPVRPGIPRRPRGGQQPLRRDPAPGLVTRLRAGHSLAATGRRVLGQALAGGILPPELPPGPGSWLGAHSREHS
jgi:hypothetical protein